MQLVAIEENAYHLNAENFIDSHTFFPSPPLAVGSKQIGHSPTYSPSFIHFTGDIHNWRRTFVVPFPFTKRGVYRSSSSRGGLGVPSATLGTVRP